MATKMRLKFKAYDHKLLDKCVNDIISLVVETGGKVRGPIPLPTKSWKIAVHKSPHIDAKSKEHYGMNTHIRLIDVLDFNSKTIEQITHFQLPSGVSVIIKN